MSEQSSPPSSQSAQTGPIAQQPAAASSPPAKASGQQASGLQSRVAAITEDKPEVAVGAAFASGFLFAMILRRFAG